MEKKETRKIKEKPVVEAEKKPQPVEITYEDVVKVLIDGYKEGASEETKKSFVALFSKYLKQEVAKQQIAENYNLLILFDNTTLVKGDSDQIYRAITVFNENKKPLLLVLLSRGGEPGSAYLIGKLCQEFCNGKFIVAVPRHAKSAATLLACAANEIHLGSLSELGPIDPQIDEMPALGLKYSIEHIAGLVTKYPASSDMFAKYLKLSIEPIQIGYYERIAESAMQYAEKLLNTHSNSLSNSPSEIATKLVYGYKDHDFVIDKTEAISIFGTNAVKSNTPEYKLANVIYNIFSKIETIAGALDFRFYFIGSLDSEPNFIKKRRR